MGRIEFPSIAYDTPPNRAHRASPQTRSHLHSWQCDHRIEFVDMSTFIKFLLCLTPLIHLFCFRQLFLRQLPLVNAHQKPSIAGIVAVRFASIAPFTYLPLIVGKPAKFPSSNTSCFCPAHATGRSTEPHRSSIFHGMFFNFVTHHHSCSSACLPHSPIDYIQWPKLLTTARDYSTLCDRIARCTSFNTEV